MRFLRIGDDLIRLDMIMRIREGRKDETYYGRSVRKTNDAFGWLEVHFVAGEVMKLEGESAEMLRRFLESEQLVQELVYH
jgi:recombinational DNA repair ATPase RecF